MTSNKNSSIYFLTSAESKVRAYCDICHHEVDGIAFVPDLDMRWTTIILKCHKTTNGVKVSDELINSGSIAGFMLTQKSIIEPIGRHNRFDPMVTLYTIKLEVAIREAKERIYKKLHGSGQWIDSTKFGVVRGSMVNPDGEIKDAEEDDFELGKGRRIILED